MPIGSSNAHHIQRSADDVSMVLSEAISANLKEFKERTDGVEKYLRRGLLWSEALSFVTMCNILNISHIVESGTANGFSTELFTLALPDTYITSIDLDTKYHLSDLTSSRLAKYPNIHLVIDNSVTHIPELLSSLDPGARVAVFVDGPKGLPGLKLIKNVSNFENVFLTGMHDIAPYISETVYREVVKWPFHVFSTSESWYRERFRHLDEDRKGLDFCQLDENKRIYGFGVAIGIPHRRAYRDPALSWKCAK